MNPDKSARIHINASLDDFSWLFGEMIARSWRPVTVLPRALVSRLSPLAFSSGAGRFGERQRG
jgi:hypothetical protein